MCAAAAACRWREQLEAWAIPQEILDAAPESPWGFSPELFARRADHLPFTPSPSTRAALDALPEGGTVLDVGCGAGAGSLPLLPRAGRLIGVDPSADLLAEFATRVRAAGRDPEVLRGSWSEAAPSAPVADVVVCHHVAYNVPDLDSFVSELTAHARRRVVLELTEQHPLSWLNDLWMRFHGLARPDGPAAADAEAVVRETGALGLERATWEPDGDTALGAFADLPSMAVWVRRRLCLRPEQDGEIERALEDRAVQRRNGVAFPPRRLVALWWDGRG